MHCHAQHFWTMLATDDQAWAYLSASIKCVLHMPGKFKMDHAVSCFRSSPRQARGQHCFATAIMHVQMHALPTRDHLLQIRVPGNSDARRARMSYLARLTDALMLANVLQQLIQIFLHSPDILTILDELHPHRLMSSYPMDEALRHQLAE